MSEEPWCQLVPTSDILADPIIITKTKYIIGRSKTADLSLLGNKLVSGTHCFIERDRHGTVWIQDTSTNGTLLNFQRKLIGVREELKHGDEIHLIYKKGEEHLNLSYVYQDLAELAKEELDMTEEYSETDQSGTSLTIPEDGEGGGSPRKRRLMESSDDEGSPVPTEKKSKHDYGDEEIAKCGDDDHVTSVPETASKPDTAESSSAKAEEVETSSAKIEDMGKSEVAQKPSAKAETDEAMEENLMCIICQELLHDCVSCQPCMHAFCGGCYSDWMKRSDECPSCRLKVKQVSKNHIVNNLVDLYLKTHPDRRRPQAELSQLDAKNKVKSDIVKPRPERTLSESMDEDPHYNNEEEEDEEEEEEEDEEDYENSEDVDAVRPAIAPVPLGGGGLFGGGGFGGGGFGGGGFGGGGFGGGGFGGGVAFTGMTGPFGTVRPPRTVCRQCPGYRDPAATTTSPITAATDALTAALTRAAGAITGGAGGGDAGEGTSGASKDEDVKVMPEAPKYACTPAQVHVLCSCCLQPMPDRRTGPRPEGPLPASTCTLCHRSFCHLYWGCRKVDCLGCIGKFKEINFGKKILSKMVLENTFESDILQNYLAEKDKTVRSLLKECCTQLYAGSFSTLDQVRGFTPDSIVCFACGLRNFREVAYQYRKSMEADDLPAGVTSRPDCHWGKNCRTQKSNIGHAARYNHICEQTRR